MSEGSGCGRVGERLLRLGVEALSASELLGLLFRDGMGERAALDVAGRLMERFGGLRRTATRTVPELMAVPGIGPARAAMVTAAERHGIRSKALVSAVGTRGAQLVPPPWVGPSDTVPMVRRA